MSRRLPHLLVLLAAAPAAVVVIGGTVSVILQSLGLMPVFGPPRVSVDAYTDIAAELPLATGISLWIATASTALAVVFGGAIALLVVGGGRLGRTLNGLGAATVTVPHLVGAAAFWLLLTETGLLPRLFGIPDSEWPALVGSNWWIGVILEYAWKESAFVALIVAGTLSVRIARFDETAAVLGAGRWQRIRLVLLPLAWPSLIITGTIVFIYTLGTYEVAWLLGRSYPEPLAVMAVRLYAAVDLTARSAAAATAVVITAVGAVVAALGFLLLRRTAWR